jgi:hypothetical protein
VPATVFGPKPSPYPTAPLTAVKKGADNHKLTQTLSAAFLLTSNTVLITPTLVH